MWQNTKYMKYSIAHETQNNGIIIVDVFNGLGRTPSAAFSMAMSSLANWGKSDIISINYVLIADVYECIIAAQKQKP